MTIVDGSTELSPLYVVLSLAAGFAVGFSTGANDAANSMGTAVGAGVRTVRQAAIIVAAFGILGALVQGHAVTATLRDGVVSFESIPSHACSAVVLSAYLSVGIWVTVTTYLGLPTSTSHSLVGAIAGAGLAVGAPLGSPAGTWAKLQLIGLAWIVTPIAAAALSLVGCRLLRRAVNGRSRRFSSLFSHLLTLSGLYMAFAWGAAGVANVAGPLLISGIMSKPAALAFGTASIATGVLLWGRKVMSTVGRELVPLIPATAFASELASAATVHFCASLGLPVSSSHAIVGGVAGAGLTNHRLRRNTINVKLCATIALSWALTPVVCLCLGFIITSLLMTRLG